MNKLSHSVTLVVDTWEERLQPSTMITKRFLSQHPAPPFQIVGNGTSLGAGQLRPGLAEWMQHASPFFWLCQGPYIYSHLK